MFCSHKLYIFLTLPTYIIYIKPCEFEVTQITCPCELISKSLFIYFQYKIVMIETFWGVKATSLDIFEFYLKCFKKEKPNKDISEDV